MKKLFICFFLWCGISHAMEPDEDIARVLAEVEDRVSRDFSHKVVRGFQECGPVIELAIEFENFVAQVFFLKRCIDEVLYLTPLFLDEEEGTELRERGLRYSLLMAAEYGIQKTFCKRIQEVGLNVMDRRLCSLKFNVVTADGKICTRADIVAGRFHSLAVSRRKTIGAHPYETFGDDASGLAYNNFHLKILKEIQNYLAVHAPDKALNVPVDQILADAELEQVQVQEAQKNGKIPVFPVLPVGDALPDGRSYEIVSDYDDELRIKAVIGEDTCIIGALSDPATWKYYYMDATAPSLRKYHYLDLDSLGTIYAYLIGFNKRDGRSVIDQYDHWKIYCTLRAHVMRDLNQKMELESYRDMQWVPKNLLRLACHAAHDTGRRLIDRFLANMLCLSVAKAYGGQGELVSREWARGLQKLVKCMMRHESPKEFCIKLCNANKPLFFVPTIKVSMQRALLQMHCAKILSHADSPLAGNLDLAERIAAHWEPDEEFLNAVRSSPLLTKEGELAINN